MTLLSQKTKNKGVLYIFSGKDLDKTLKIIRKNTFLFGFRRNPEKFLEKKAKSLKILEAYKKLKQGKLF